MPRLLSVFSHPFLLWEPAPLGHVRDPTRCDPAAFEAANERQDKAGIVAWEGDAFIRQSWETQNAAGDASQHFLKHTPQKRALRGWIHNPSTSINPEGKARPERLSAALLHGWRNNRTIWAQLWRQQQGSMKTRGIKQQKHKRCSHLNKRMNQLVTWSQSSCPCEPAMPTFLDVPVDRAPSQPMPWAWEEGREAEGPGRHHTSATGGKEATWILGNSQSHTRVTLSLLTAAHDAGL